MRRGAAGGDEVREGVGLLVGGPISVLRIWALLSVKQGTSGQRERRAGLARRKQEAGGRLVAGWEPGFLRNPVPFPLIS